MSQTIFITEDEENIRELLRCTVESFRYAVEVFETAEDLLERTRQQVPDLILLDIMLPGMDGLEALQRLRQGKTTARVPVILLTAKSSEVDKVRGLDFGADDYITKPFGVLELSARIRTALRRTEESAPPVATLPAVLRTAHITLDTKNHEVTADGCVVELTLKEFDLLRILMTQSGVVEREELLSTIWGYDYVGETRTLDMHIKTLRAKLGDNAETPHLIKTVRGVGYKFIG